MLLDTHFIVSAIRFICRLVLRGNDLRKLYPAAACCLFVMLMSVDMVGRANERMKNMAGSFMTGM